ncbi:unnamed protein product, partial [Pylaiella littoralis]
GRGREAAAGASGGRRESDVAPSSLSNEEVEAVVAYVGMDEFGGVHAEEFRHVISAAKKGNIPDAHVADCVRRIDGMLRLRRLSIRDVFRKLNSDGSGKLSREELAQRVRELSGHDRARVIQRRKDERGRRRA